VQISFEMSASLPPKDGSERQGALELEPNLIMRGPCASFQINLLTAVNKLTASATASVTAQLARERTSEFFGGLGVAFF
jgi:hypothetical protein